MVSKTKNHIPTRQDKERVKMKEEENVGEREKEKEAGGKGPHMIT